MTLNVEERSKREQRRQGTLGRRVLNSGWQGQSVVMLPPNTDVDHQLPTNLLSVHRVLSQLLLLAQSCGTVLHMTLHVCFIIDSVSAKTENTFISAVISEHYYVLVACLRLFSPWWS